MSPAAAARTVWLSASVVKLVSALAALPTAEATTTRAW